MGSASDARRTEGRLSAAGLSVAEPVAALLVSLPLLLNLTHYTTDPLGFPLEVLLCVAAGFAGRWPVAAGVATGLVLTALLAVPTPGARWGVLAMLIPIVSVGARGYRRVQAAFVVWFLAVMVLGDYVPGATERPRDLQEAATNVIGWAFFATAAVLVSVALRAAGRDRARLVRDRAAAVQAQRRAIARDLHDTTASAMTSIVMRAEQAKLRGVADPLLLADLDYIIAAGRDSVRDLRAMMETLRRNEPDGAVPAASPWRVTSLADAVASRSSELRAHGFTVTSCLEVDEDTLPASVREALAKLVVEATSNMIKHGDRSAPASIMIERGEAEVEAVFVNRVAPGPAPHRESARLGLVGARERIEALGGEVDVLSESPSWVVRAAFPLEDR